MRKSEPHPADLYVGSRLRQLRKKHRMSQANLAELIGVSHQQIQQYETGGSRVSAGTLFDLTQVLNVPPNYFYEGFTTNTPEKNIFAQDNVICTERHKPLHILIAEGNPDDEARTRELLLHYKKDAEVNVIRDGQELLQHLRKTNGTSNHPLPDVILLELDLPGIDGFSLLKELKRDRLLQSIPVIIYTNSINPHDVTESYRLQASGFIKKSFEFDDFRKTFHRVVEYWSSVVLPSMQYH